MMRLLIGILGVILSVLVLLGVDTMGPLIVSSFLTLLHLPKKGQLFLKVISVIGLVSVLIAISIQASNLVSSITEDEGTMLLLLAMGICILNVALHVRGMWSSYRDMQRERKQPTSSS